MAEKKIKTANDIDELERQFSDINTKYDYSTKTNSKLDKDLNLTKLDDITKSDDEISALAKDSMKDYYKDNVEKISTDNLNNQNDLKKSIEDKTASTKTLKNNIDMNIESAKEVTSNDALKRGLSRSSIVINKLGAFDDKKLEEYNTIDKSLTDTVNSLNFQIDSLETQKESALKDFDISYASKLNTKIDELKTDLVDKQEEITKYNNQIAEIEADYEKEKVDFNNNAEQDNLENSLELTNFVAKYGVSSLDALKNSEKYQSAYSYFKTLSKEDALSTIKANNGLKTQLGNYYNQLLSEFI